MNTQLFYFHKIPGPPEGAPEGNPRQFPQKDKISAQAVQVPYHTLKHTFNFISLSKKMTH
jgi:hypothetical protein